MLSRYTLHRRGLAVVAAGLLAAACGDPTVRYVGEPQAGPPGPAGPEGPQGAVGAQGATGATGAKGTTSAPPRNRGKLKRSSSRRRATWPTVLRTRISRT